MIKQSSNFAAIQWLLILFTGLVLLGACTPSTEEKTTPTSATIIASTIPAAVTNTLPPPRVITPTPTPKATPAPTEDLLSWNTPDPFSPTQTPRVTATSTPPGSAVTRISEWPELENDVLFLVDNSLQLWDHQNRELVLLLASTAEEVSDDYSSLPIPGEITDYQISPDGQTVIVSRVVTVEPRIQEFILIHLTTRESRTLIPPSQISKPSFSPDGRQIAYIRGEGAEISSNDEAEFYNVVVENIFDDDPPRIVDNCFNKLEADPIRVRICLRNRIVWSPDSRLLLWSDRRGVVSHNLDTGAIEKFTTHVNIGLSGPKQLSEKYFSAEDWSPSGRFLRLAASGYEYYEEFIYDSESGQLFEIPNSYGGLGPEKYAIWLSDDTIFLVRQSSNRSETNAEISRFDPATGDWAVESTYIFSSNDDTYPTAPMLLEDGSVGLVILNRQETNSMAEFYRSESLANGNLQFTQLPTVVPNESFSDVYWSPNGSGVMFVKWFGNDEYLVEYVAVVEEVAYDLSFALGFDVKSLYWLP